MCGIIGYTGKRDAVPIIIDGLRRLEYRGYDSAGIACLSEGGVDVKRCKGKISDLDSMLKDYKVSSSTAIGHTRWATHGRPSEENAHPHRSDGIVVVHNGIIENYLELKKVLESEGFSFTSETDTEVVCHLIKKHSSGKGLEDSVREAVRSVKGAYAIAAMSEDEPGTLVVVRKDSPLVVGLGDGECFVASDIPAFLSHTRDVFFMEDGEMAVLRPEGVSFSTLDGKQLDKDSTTITWSAAMAEKGGYKHFMLKEIFEQPRAIADTITGRLSSHEAGEVNMEEFGIDPERLSSFRKIFIVACGTSWHAGIVGKYLMESISRVPVEVDIASEFRYRNPMLGPEDLFISITQSGETADTLAAQRLAKGHGAFTLNICNVVGSTSSREADAVFFTRSGPEIGVASTKAFTAQIVSLYLLCVAIGRARGKIDGNRASGLLNDLLTVPDLVERILQKNEHIESIAREFHRKEAFLFLGRGIQHPIALEGALKLKEISYIHAEGYPAGEMKHGPIALIDDGYPVAVLAPRDELYDKVASNIQEIKSRGGSIIMVTEESNAAPASEIAEHLITVPDTTFYLMPVLAAVPLQLLAYHIGVIRGCDVDQPRNLAKSVTVE
jgi:glucosamine--fructose-6-phosphate aminotransferase (isomerizing)